MFLEPMDPCKPIVAARPSAVPEVIRHGVLVKPENEDSGSVSGSDRKTAWGSSGFAVCYGKIICSAYSSIGLVATRARLCFISIFRIMLWRFGTPGIIIERQVVS